MDLDLSLDECSDVHLINELEKRGYTIHDEDDVDQSNVLIQDLEEIYLDYMLMGDSFFDRKLRKLFNKHLNKTLIIS